MTLFVDASAIVAIIAEESDAAAFAEKITASENAITSPVAIVEASMAIARIFVKRPIAAEEVVRAFLEAFDITVRDLPPDAAAIAVAAYDRFGKGRHPANLNLGDCLAYAAARCYGADILYKGNDFALTDMAIT